LQDKIERSDLKNMCTALLLEGSNLMESISEENSFITHINIHKSLMFHLGACVITRFVIVV